MRPKSLRRDYLSVCVSLFKNAPRTERQNSRLVNDTGHAAGAVAREGAEEPDRVGIVYGEGESSGLDRFC